MQEVLRLILEAYYDVQFSKRSHGFRPGRGCHTALTEIYHGWVGTKWLIEGDIRGCFDALDHTVLVAILAEKIHDQRFLGLVRSLLKAGYLEEWRYHETLSGSPQGGIVSPILSNIYLDKLDQFVEGVLCPAYTSGERRRPNPPYLRLRDQRQCLKKRGDTEEARALFQQMQRLPSLDPADPGYRRLHYVRYADDTLLGFIGPKCEAEEIKHRLTEFLRQDLKLELSEEKTLITHAASQAARFLGYDIAVLKNDVKRDRRGYRSINGQIGLTVPSDVVQDACTRYLRHAKPVHRPELLHNAVYDIVVQYQAEYRGLVQYYQLAYDLHRFNRLKWVMEQSLTKTLAHKLRRSVETVYERYRALLQTEYGATPGLRVVVDRGAGKKPLVATWGGLPLRRQMTATLLDHRPPPYAGRSELVQRLLADRCELCGSRDAVQVHHVRALKDLHRAGRPDKPTWARVMAARHRKTLVVCRACHVAIHAGRPTRPVNAD